MGLPASKVSWPEGTRVRVRMRVGWRGREGVLVEALHVGATSVSVRFDGESSARRVSVARVWRIGTSGASRG